MCRNTTTAAVASIAAQPVHVRNGIYRKAFHTDLQCLHLTGKQETYGGQTAMSEEEALIMGMTACRSCRPVEDFLIPVEAARLIAQQIQAPGMTYLRAARIFLTLAAAGYPTGTIADMAGVTPLMVTIRMQLLALGQDGRAALDAGTVPVGLAWYIARLTTPNQRLVLARWNRGEFKDSHHAGDVATEIYQDENPA